MLHYLPLIHNTTILARGGGGGSGGGGGGSGFILLSLVGFLPTYYYARFIERRMKNLAGIALIIIGTLLYSSGWFYFQIFSFWGIIIGIAALLGGIGGYNEVLEAVSSSVRKRMKSKMATAAASDSAWDEARLMQMAQTTFMQFQQDWSVGNMQNFATYMTPQFAYHNQLIIYALGLRNRQNILSDIKILDMTVSDLTDEADNTKDRVTFYFKAQMQDQLVETKDGNRYSLFVDSSEFEEKWLFNRGVAGNWVLADIEQIDTDVEIDPGPIRQFASAHSMYYREDWGWLLLPTRGRLFGNGKFGTSNINSHVIGVYNNLVVEMYNYIEDLNGSNSSQYLIAQVALPKYYQSIIVEAKDSALKEFVNRTPSGYNNITLEWPDFNQRYNVYATDVEQVTAFELLHPVFMEKLFALPFKLNIEVVENVVYLYTKEANADYETMFSILQDAFKEMRL